MNYEELVKLIEKLDQSSLAFLEFNQDGNKIVLSKEVPQVAHAQVVNSQPSEGILNASVASDPVQTSASPLQTSTPSIAPVATNFENVKSPIVGVVYLQPKPDAAPFVEVGTLVEKGQTVCIIEAMKLMNEITAPVSGVVKEILVTNEMVVEFDQVLLTIEPQ